MFYSPVQDATLDDEKNLFLFIKDATNPTVAFNGRSGTISQNHVLLDGTIMQSCLKDIYNSGNVPLSCLYINSEGQT